MTTMRTLTADEMRVVTDGLEFPEGPVWLKDSSVLVVEIKGQNLVQVFPVGRKKVVAKLGGGPNGAAIGPDGACYVCNNGGFNWTKRDGRTVTTGVADDYVSGSIQRVDLATGKFETLYDRVGENIIRGPNDLVFDAHAGFYFTDMGKARGRVIDRGSVCYGKADGSSVKELVFPISMPNGAVLSPDGKKPCADLAAT